MVSLDLLDVSLTQWGKLNVNDCFFNLFHMVLCMHI